MLLPVLSQVREFRITFNILNLTKNRPCYHELNGHCTDVTPPPPPWLGPLYDYEDVYAPVHLGRR